MDTLNIIGEEILPKWKKGNKWYWDIYCLYDFEPGHKELQEGVLYSKTNTSGKVRVIVDIFENGENGTAYILLPDMFVYKNYGLTEEQLKKYFEVVQDNKDKILELAWVK